MRRACDAAQTLRAGVPVPHVAARDPMAVRALVLRCAWSRTFFVAGGDRMKRVAAAFDWQGGDHAREFPHRRLDVAAAIPASRR